MIIKIGVCINIDTYQRTPRGEIKNVGIMPQLTEDGLIRFKEQF